MSIDLDWSKLDFNLADSVVAILNGHLASMSRPELFIGPITVTHLDFGTNPPEIELVDIKDVSPVFLEDDVPSPFATDQLDERYQHLPFHVRQRMGKFAASPSLNHPWAEDPAATATSERANSFQHWPPLQLHFRVSYNSDLRLTMTTSLLINYPSPLFLSLPIKLHLTGILLNAEVILAYEAVTDKRRLHFCLVEESDPTMRPALGTDHTGPASFNTQEKSPAIGHRMLPQITIESEIGDADKHALKNVSRVERFIQDTIRTLLVDELVFPNYQTIVFE